MHTAQLIKRNLVYFWRTNAAVVLGVATAVAVLAGALLVGDSVRGSLSDLFLQRLGQTDHVVTSSGFFREQLADDLRNIEGFSSAGLADTVSLIELPGSVSSETSKARAGDVRVYGVDERFWSFHARQAAAPQNREVLISEALARELGTAPGDALLVQIEKPSDVPIESLYGHKEDLGRTLRLNLRATLGAEMMGEFATRPQQTPVKAAFVPLQLLQKELQQEGRANLLLVSSAKDSAGLSDTDRTAALKNLINRAATLEDYSVIARPLDQQRGISLERRSTLLEDELVETASAEASKNSAATVPILSYVANSITVGDRTVPYSLVTAIDDRTFQNFASGEEKTGDEEERASNAQPIILNEWTARDLGAKPGDQVSLEYFQWHDNGKLETKTAEFRLVRVVPIAGLAADRDLVPDYPGITESPNLSDWDPPFPVDLKRIRPQDEDYWARYRTTPKAFIPLNVGQQLWQSRFGKLTSLRVVPPSDIALEQASSRFQQGLQTAVQSAGMGLTVLPVRQEGLAASQGATDFGEYFLYFSFFLVVSALLLTALFFKLGVEQRLREIGLLKAVGFNAASIRNMFLGEGLILAILGSMLGLVGALAYGQLMMTGLNTWWIDAVGTNMLRLHVRPISLLLGAAGGVVAAMLCIVWTLKRVGRASARSLMAGSVSKGRNLRGKEGKDEKGKSVTLSRFARLLSSFTVAIALTVLGTVLLLAASLKLISETAGFFGGGTLFLGALLCFQSAWLRREHPGSLGGTGWWPISRLGFRNTTYRPGRSVLCIALIASAAFIIVSVDAFRRKEGATVLDRKTGSGGFALLAESLLPLVHDLNSEEGREALNLAGNGEQLPLSNVSFTRFRVRPGDDASCLNLYQPRNPKIIAAGSDFIKSGRFKFQDSLAVSNEEKENPWLLLDREFPDGATPVIADANSLTYVLHLKLGDDFVLQQQSGQTRLRIVAALADSVFQSELVMSERNFLKLFPEQEGHRLFLIDTDSSEASSVATALEDRLADFGFDVVPTAERLANFHRVENTYLSTFQMLGGLGLILGTVGLAAVLLRNVFERRKELALLRAVGYHSSHFTLMAIAENALLLFGGLMTGTVCALLAIAPVFFERGGRLPNISLGVLLLAVLISGLTASLIATWAALRSPLLPALRAE